ncbi:DUF4388 domain-containing protein [Anaeromyxobacter diazotrophicus]|uniref:PatA-like N-terminal domain-containing protein n=1 Tax=Anaeromyxobacter diazotrophicus TaxID=2590199 RepID=A0A7I9VL45_9BACT|nr:DUF4388 domain-containing protein [Anaeromyxobacter diazotrophicus]GEJ56908.1 hypothetical protein AMYX_16490 [Anaeromyxobacter diazotrophicus]
MPLHVDIDAHGRIVPQDDQARRLLADRAGRFELLPSAPDLLLGRRTPAAGGASQRPRCVLAGDLAAFPIADFIAFVHQSRLSGLLRVAAAGGDRTVVFREGEVRGAHSQAAGERLGEIAVRLGYLRPAGLEQALRAAAGPAGLGKALVDGGLVSAPDLWKCLHEQVAAVFHAILLSREGVFTLLDEEAPELGTPLSVNTQSLLMDGIRRIDELSLFRARIPGPEAFLRRREPKVPITLQPVERELLGLVDGRRTVAEVAQRAHLSPFDATKVLYHLAEAGYLEASAQPLGARGQSPDERAGAIGEGMAGILREVAVAVEAAGGREPFLAAVRAFLADPAGRFAFAWTGIAPARDGAVDPAAVRANVEAARVSDDDGDRLTVLFDALHELVLFYLFQSGELLARAEDERLGREVKERFEALAELR